jgi:hypothetical protein
MGKKSTKPTMSVRAWQEISKWVAKIADAEDIHAADIISPILEESLRDRYVRAARIVEARERAIRIEAEKISKEKKAQ